MPAVPQYDKLYVLNCALRKVPLPEKASLNDIDWDALVLFDNCVAQVLQSYEWNFAQTIITLQRSATKPSTGYLYSYDMPADCIRVLSIRQHETLRAPQARFSTPGRKIYCNISPCNLQYVRFVNDPEDWPPAFLDAVACRIAMEIAALAAQDAQASMRLVAMYERALGIAQQIDATETRQRIPLDFSIYAASGRGQGGRKSAE